MPEISDRELARYKAIEADYKALERDWQVAITQVRRNYLRVGAGLLMLGVGLIAVVVLGLSAQNAETNSVQDLAQRVAAAQAAQQHSRFDAVRDLCKADNARTAGELTVIRTVAPQFVGLARLALPPHIKDCKAYAANIVRPEKVQPPH